MSRILITPIIAKNDFISKANEIYDSERFDYSLIPESFKKTEYLRIICSTHGIFKTTYYKFIEKKTGCKECKKDEKKEQRRLFYQQKFIEESTIVHNGFYNYDKVYYRGKDVKVIITCPIHGDFEQSPHEHKAGAGCKECARQKLIELNRRTTEEFIEKARKIHNDFYIYDKTNYITSSVKVIITCPIHGDFDILPSSHLKGCGCQKCANERKGSGSEKGTCGKPKTTEQFIKDSKEIFGDYYDYSKTNYINARTDVIITCPKHGDFSVNPNKHLSSHQGYKECTLERLIERTASTTEEFIKRSKEIFGDFYDYSKTVYTNNRTKLIITCPIHGDFEISPGKHLNAHHGCPECGKSKSANANRYTLEDFIRIGNMNFNDFYDYSETVYTSINDNVDIICPKHGKFTVNAYYHLHGYGECPECVRERQMMSFEEFLAAAKKIYNDYYDYSEVEYVDYNKEIKIICPKHGPFFVTPQNHIRHSKGCPKCNFTNIERDINTILINNNINFETQKTFEWLLFKKNMYLDIYIDSIKVAIECQGIQHFELCDFYGYTEETFELYKQRDRLKKQLCDEHGIDVLYFTDKLYNENYELGHLYTNKEDILKIILKRINEKRT